MTDFTAAMRTADDLLEEAICSAKAALQVGIDAYERRIAATRLETLIKARSLNQIARMEREKGLA